MQGETGQTLAISNNVRVGVYEARKNMASRILIGIGLGTYDRACCARKHGAYATAFDV
jgi:hypothetical protein